MTPAPRHDSPYPVNGEPVPWRVYARDREADERNRADARRELREDLLRIESKMVEGFAQTTRRLDALELDDALDDAGEVAAQAARVALDEKARSRGERVWDLTKIALAGSLGAVLAIATAQLT